MEYDMAAVASVPSAAAKMAANSLPTLLVWSVTLCMISSFVLASILFIRCALYLRRTKRRIGGRRELVKHIALIAAADACMAAWSYSGSVVQTKSLLVKGDPEWCVLFTTVRMWLILTSALGTGSLALGTLAALSGRLQQVKVLRRTASGIVPLSLLLCSHNLLELCRMEAAYDGSVDCVQSERSVTIECVEQTLILVFVFRVLVLAHSRARQRPPHSLEAKAIRVVSRYLMAYTLSYGCWIIARWPQLNRLFRHAYWWPIFVAFSWRLLVLNGAFNFVALWLHARDSVKDLNQSMHIPILEDDAVSTVKFTPINQRSLEKNIRAEVAEIQNSNQRQWRELGLTYEQGLAGQVEPLSEEERADHFYSILNYSGKLQNAQVV